jgi:hypothetical protein
MKKTPRGQRCNNPGNIDRVAGVRWQGELSLKEEKLQDSRFCVFVSPEYGIRALMRTLITYATARKARNGTPIDTVQEVIDRWAPPVENDTAAYAKEVAKDLGVGKDEKINILDPDILMALARSIIEHECAGLVYEDDVMERALQMALPKYVAV